MSRVRRILSIAPCLAFIFPTLGSGQESKVAPDLAELARIGRRSLERFARDSYAWTATTPIRNGVAFVVEVTATPDMRRSVLSVEAQGRRQEFARLIHRDGAWYVVQGAQAGKYRPYEVPFEIPTAYLHLNRSEPRFVTEPDPKAFGTFDGTKNGIATYRTPVPEPLGQQLRSSIEEFDRFAKRNPGEAIKPETLRAIESARDLLDRGVSTDVELATGMIVEYGSPERRTIIGDFRRLERADPETFSIRGRRWDDFTDDPTRGNRDDLIMMGHCGVWRPGMPSPEADGRLLDLKTGRHRRIPFRGDLTLPGCFSRDRTRVYVTGADTDSGALGLYEIDLRTGENRQLGGEPLATGFSLFPCLSPDGKAMAVLHKGAGERLLETRIHLVDLASGDAKPLGASRDFGPISWLPDGLGILTAERESVDPSKPPLSTLCRVDLEGHLHAIRECNSPIPVGDGRTILYEDGTTRTWRTCDLDGKEERPYADGLKGHAFPAPSSDGKRLVMMRFRTGQTPSPIIFRLGESEGMPVNVAPGLWKSPSWR